MISKHGLKLRGKSILWVLVQKMAQTRLLFVLYKLDLLESIYYKKYLGKNNKILKQHPQKKRIGNKFRPVISWKLKHNNNISKN